MRMYALLLGVILTSGYGYAAQVAVASAAAGRAPAPTPKAAVLDQVWYGGILDPVIVEGRGSPRAAGTEHRALQRLTLRCADADRSSLHAMF
jgi:hypothetical protein